MYTGKAFVTIMTDGFISPQMYVTSHYLTFQSCCYETLFTLIGTQHGTSFGLYNGL